MKPINEIFHIEYGSQLDLNKCDICKYPDGYNFVNRSEKNNGVSARIYEDDKLEPFSAGLITVAMGGSVLASFVQQEPFYTGQNVKVLKPLNPMPDIIKLYYCYCIQANRFRFSTFGREANSRFDKMLVPDINELPEYIKNISISNYQPDKKPFLNKKLELNTGKWEWFNISSLFKIYTSKEENAINRTDGHVPFISSTQFMNGISKYVDDKPTIPSNTITVARNGSVGSAFYQPIPYCASPDDIRIFEPKFKINKYIAFFLLPIIELEKFRYQYGRKFGTKRMKQTKIKLPVTKAGSPDWQFMENYIKSLPYSKEL